jgi:HTH-type transcriptional regulator/antitoxin HipB
MIDYTELGFIIRFHRKKARLSQLELSRLAGVGKTVVFDLEKGKATVQLNSLVQVLQVLNIKIEFISPLMSLFKETYVKKS